MVANLVVKIPFIGRTCGLSPIGSSNFPTFYSPFESIKLLIFSEFGECLGIDYVDAWYCDGIPKEPMANGLWDIFPVDMRNVLVLANRLWDISKAKCYTTFTECMPGPFGHFRGHLVYQHQKCGWDQWGRMSDIEE